MLILDAFILYWFMNMLCIEVESFRRVNHVYGKSFKPDKLGSHIRTEDEDQLMEFKTTERPEVTSKVFDPAENFENLRGKKKPAKSSLRSDSKRTQGVFKLQKSNNEPANQEKEDLLPLKVVESLVMSIQENNNQNIADIVKDIHDKLDMVYTKKVGGKMLRNGPVTTEGPKDVIQEMDKILKDFLRKGKSGEIVETAPVKKNLYAKVEDDESPYMRASDRSQPPDHDDEGPYMRGSNRFQPPAHDENLEYDLDGGELSVAWKDI